MNVRINHKATATVCIALLGCSCFMLLAAQFYGFVLDDAYISFRYAKHLSEGAGLLWNLGEDPVEGYTSFLWVVIHAGAIKLNFNPAVFSKILSCISSLLIIIILSISTRTIPWPLRIVTVVGVALNPAFALVTMMGMETVLTSLLALLLAMASMRLLNTWSLFNAMLLHGLAILSMLSRPDMAPFVFGMYLGIFGIYFVDRRLREMRQFFPTFVLPLVIGLGYMYWRLQYFGYLFPNTFYLKTLHGPTGLPVYLKTYFPDSPFPGLSYVISFVKDLTLPYLLVAIIIYSISQNTVMNRRMAPSLLGSIAFLSFLLFITPIQGFFWRYAMPVLPVWLYLFSAIMQNGAMGSSTLPMKTLPSISLALLFILWPLKYNEQARFINNQLFLKDEIIVGKALSNLHGTMFVTDSGALPYFSGWSAVDHLGLNSETIAHQGLTVDFLRTLHPDLIMLSMKNEVDRWSDYPVVNKYLQNEDYGVGAAISSNPSRIHLYLIRKNSKLFPTLLSIFRELKGVSYIDPHSIAGDQNHIDLLTKPN